MPNCGTQNYSLSINGSYTIPEGYHSGEGKVTQSVTTMKGSNITPNTSVVTIPTNQKYIDGNFTIPAFALPSASILKKGATYTLYGKKVTGEFEGFVPSVTDLYYKGNNIANFSFKVVYGYSVLGSVKFETAQMITTSDRNGTAGPLCSGRSYNLTPYNSINVEVNPPTSSIPLSTVYRSVVFHYGSDLNTRDAFINSTKPSTYVFSFDISGINATKWFAFMFFYKENTSAYKGIINRIWFS